MIGLQSIQQWCSEHLGLVIILGDALIAILTYPKVKTIVRKEVGDKYSYPHVMGSMLLSIAWVFFYIVMIAEYMQHKTPPKWL